MITLLPKAVAAEPMQPQLQQEQLMKKKRGRPRTRTRNITKVTKRHRPKMPRMICTVCLQPNAIRYYHVHKKKDGTVSRQLIYEHRDEAPLKEYWYITKAGRKQHHFRYRRCNAGVVKAADLSILSES